MEAFFEGLRLNLLRYLIDHQRIVPPTCTSPAISAPCHRLQQAPDCPRAQRT